MARWAILSDIHGNLEALDAVLADAEACGAERIAVLGDTIDNGPDPVACLTRVAAVSDVLLVGNHEEHAVVPDPYQEESEVLDWSLIDLEQCEVWRDMRQTIRERGAPALASVVAEPMHFVHASAGRPTIQYVWPAHEVQYVVYNTQISDRLAKFLGEFKQPLGFNGHTHVPAVLTRYENRDLFDPYKGCKRNYRYTFWSPEMIFFVPDQPCVLEGIGGRTMAVNVGSVGQSRRLGDNRASYVLCDGDRLEFRRVEYDWRATAAKIAALPVDEEERSRLVERLETGI